MSSTFEGGGGSVLHVKITPSIQIKGQSDGSYQLYGQVAWKWVVGR